MQEQRSFSVDPAIIFSIIKNQCGTLEKALTEAIMNSVDAQASRCDIELTRTGYTVKDDGKGFADRSEIISFFERFGTPHTEGDATYGRYRMGRGQGFSFGRNIWRTGHFLMDVDIKNRGLDYTLAECTEFAPGCAIEAELYEPLLPSECDATLRALKEMAAYVNIPVSVNGKVVSQDPDQASWDVVNGDAYIKFRDTGGLKVYNLGVLVREYPRYHFGVSGVVVSRQPLGVNFARNDILLTQCAVWKRIRKVLDKLGKDQAVRAPRMDDEQRQLLANSVMAGEIRDWWDLRLITDTTGRQHPLRKLTQFCHYGELNRWNRMPLTVEPVSGSMIADKVHQAKEGFVLSKTTLERFGAESLEDFARLISELMNRRGYRNSQLYWVSFEELATGYSDQHVEFDYNKLPKAEQAVLTTLNACSGKVADLLLKAGVLEGNSWRHVMRELRAGVSDTALAWTDGQRAIWLNRTVLAQAAKSQSGFFSAISTLVHEYLHRASDKDSHRHDAEFYEHFHTIMGDPPIYEIAGKGFARLVKTLRQRGIRLPSAVKKMEDVEALCEQAPASEDALSGTY